MICILVIIALGMVVGSYAALGRIIFVLWKDRQRIESVAKQRERLINFTGAAVMQADQRIRTLQRQEWQN